jgi:pimeloyl-ACP methyl ester carboxylesterase
MRAHIAGEGPAVVLLHGQPGSHRDWRRVTKRLARTHQVFAVDRSGYGDASRESARGFAENADDLAALLDSHGIDQATVVGHSWGGGAALSFAQRHPDRVAALVLVAAAGTSDALGAGDTFLGLPVVGPLVALGVFRYLAPRFAHRWMKLSGSRISPAHSAEMVDEVRSWRRRPTWRSFLAEQRAMLREAPGVESHLGDVTAPTTVVIGGRDKVVRPSVGEHLAAAIPGARVRRVEEGGHLLPLEHPDELADAIREAAPSS